MALRGRQFKTSHLIDNNEIGLTMCGQLLPYKSASDPTPWDMGGGHEARWDDDHRSGTHHDCAACASGYDARVDQIDKDRAARAAKDGWY
jgi:hypothetical protein